MRLTFYDGAGCIGGNKILLEADDTALLLDFGTNFGAEGRFFDEFLRPRGTTGIGDLLDLGLLPPLEGIYRPDLDLPERPWWERARCRPLYRALRLDAVLLSHAHLDHSGYISYLRADVPVVTSLETAVIAKAMQDTQGAGFNEVCYVTPREVREGLLGATPYRKVAAEARPFVLLGDGEPCDDRFRAFWGQGRSSRALNQRPPACRREGATQVGGVTVRRFPVDHSVPGASAFAVRTSEGWVVYTGDLRLHGARAEETRAFVRAAAALRPLALITEGTHPEREEPIPEQRVYELAAEAVRSARGLVVADFGPRNVERLLTFHRVARETGRRLAVTAKDAYLLEALHAATVAGAPATAGAGAAPPWTVPDPLADETLAVYVEAKLDRDAWERALVERYLDLAPDRVARAELVARRPDEYICCFSYYDLHELLDIWPQGGSYIYSSSEAFNEEMHIDLDRLRAWVGHFRMRLVGDPGDREGRGREPGFHASGHIHGPGLEEMVEAIDPEVVIAVHTQSPDWFRRRFGGRRPVIVPEPGQVVELPLAGRAAAARPAG